MLRDDINFFVGSRADLDKFIIVGSATGKGIFLFNWVVNVEELKIIFLI